MWLDKIIEEIKELLGGSFFKSWVGRTIRSDKVCEGVHEDQMDWTFIGNVYHWEDKSFVVIKAHIFLQEHGFDSFKVVDIGHYDRGW